MIAALQIASRSSYARADEHCTVSRSDFCQALGRAGVNISQTALARLVEWLDPSLSGDIDWRSFVVGGSSPYFFNGCRYLVAREFLQLNWFFITAACDESESSDRLSGLIKAEKFKSIVQRIFECHGENSDIYASCGGKGVVLETLDEISEAFTRKSDVLKRLSYQNLLAHFAGETALTESILSARWELIWEVLGSTWGNVTIQELKESLQKPEARRLILCVCCILTD